MSGTSVSVSDMEERLRVKVSERERVSEREQFVISDSLSMHVAWGCWCEFKSGLRVRVRE